MQTTSYMSTETIQKLNLIATITAKYSLLGDVFQKAAATDNRQLENVTSATMGQIEGFFDQFNTDDLRNLVG